MTSSRNNLRPGVAERIKLLTPKYGPPGSRIPGSKYVRWYCDFCGEPMRVSGKPWPPPVRDCERCAGRHGQIAVGTYRSHVDDSGGSQANAVRAMEGD